MLTITLLSIVACGAILAGLTAAFAQTSTTTTPTKTATQDSSLPEMQFGGGMGMMMSDQQFGAGPRGPMGHGGRGTGMGGPMGQIGHIQLSAEFNQTINSILTNDSDVQNLIAQGYNVTSVRPILTPTINGNGTVTTQASTAVVTMVNGTYGFATIKVDLTNAKVTEIVTLIRTVIDKSGS
jgi:hypothetical protein